MGTPSDFIHLFHRRHESSKDRSQRVTAEEKRTSNDHHAETTNSAPQSPQERKYLKDPFRNTNHPDINYYDPMSQKRNASPGIDPSNTGA
ncbi:hypothetical protein O0I10_005932 [Lichtheimia ornata]|uniref:Uncharacterized protein n=1 Tax=Lichtheimia ornata TaxID=688661 RepID=A0AAD7XXK8_9FUNG|nr:uncharacterized protein O0I10_005932 [Lichtheimia ornata]KAJ8658250.1 hypothetical protein O0I10_005932 [Lichtheimia ornata]